MNNKIVMHALLIVMCIILMLTAFPFLITKLFYKNHTVKNTADFEITKVPEKIDVYITDSSDIVTLNFEDYIKGVVACEMPSYFHEEALKAQAVAARTYSAARSVNVDSSSHFGAALCDSTHCQVYKSPAELRKLKGSRWMRKDWKKICSAVDDTKGQLLYYDGKLVESALFHSSSGGRTENSEDVFATAVPYLVSVESPYENSATHQNEKNSFGLSEFSEIIKEKFPENNFGEISSSNIKILSRSSGGRADKIQIGLSTLTGREVREALELPSANFDLYVSNNKITFISNGSGHGVGMSQYGADGMAKAGYNYRQILNHYYSGTEIF